MNKQNVLYAHNGILLDHKKEWSTDTRYDMDGLENIMPSEVNQTQKASHYMFALTQIGKSIKTEKEKVVAVNS